VRYARDDQTRPDFVALVALATLACLDRYDGVFLVWRQRLTLLWTRRFGRTCASRLRDVGILCVVPGTAAVAPGCVRNYLVSGTLTGVRSLSSQGLSVHFGGGGTPPRRTVRVVRAVLSSGWLRGAVRAVSLR
jgi:hypothetical protein